MSERKAESPKKRKTKLTEVFAGYSTKIEAVVHSDGRSVTIKTPDGVLKAIDIKKIADTIEKAADKQSRVMYSQGTYTQIKVGGEPFYVFLNVDEDEPARKTEFQLMDYYCHTSNC